MTKHSFFGALQLLVAWWALFLVGPAQAQAPPPTAAEATDRQILVMLKMSPPHYRPNASYGGGYGDVATSSARQRVARGIARENGLKVVESWPMPLLGVDCFVMSLPEGLTVEAAIEKVSRNPMVSWSEPMATYRSFGSSDPPNDPLYRIAPAAKSWRLADLHRVATGRGVSIAIVDSRVDVDHPDLKGQFIANSDFVKGRRGPAERHGTEVAGIIGAREGNGVGMVGIAPNARLMALRACWQTPERTLCDSLSLARALLFAVEHSAQVINLSLSGPPSPLLQKLVTIALEHKASVVAAFDPKLPDGGFPASLPGVIAVADESLPNVPSGLYVAPGRDVPTTQPGGKWYLVNGSSYAAAHVSGLIALVRERSHGAAAPISIARTSAGVVDACATLLRVSRACDCSCALARQFVAVANH